MDSYQVHLGIYHADIDEYSAAVLEHAAVAACQQQERATNWACYMICILNNAMRSVSAAIDAARSAHAEDVPYLCIAKNNIAFALAGYACFLHNQEPDIFPEVPYLDQLARSFETLLCGIPRSSLAMYVGCDITIDTFLAARAVRDARDDHTVPVFTLLPAASATAGATASDAGATASAAAKITDHKAELLRVGYILMGVLELLPTAKNLPKCEKIAALLVDAYLEQFMTWCKQHGESPDSIARPSAADYRMCAAVASNMRALMGPVMKIDMHRAVVQAERKFARANVMYGLLDKPTA